jgi:uncharacterized membrane protein YccF (DUF307 family)
MRLIGNIIWFILGGVIMGLLWWFYGLLAYISIIGIPWGKACFVFGNFMFWPFGREAIDRRELSGEDDIGTGTLGLIGNIIWLFLAGIWLALAHLTSALFLLITIIGIPFAIQHVKLAVMALMPIGKTVVSKDVAEAARRRNADAIINAMKK